MKTLTKLRSSTPMLIGTVLLLAGIAINAFAHPHRGEQGRRKRTSWNQSNRHPHLAPPRGHYPRQMQQPDPRVRNFLFPPLPPHRQMQHRPMMNRAMPAQAPLKSPFLVALDKDDDGFIDAKEIAQAAKALRAMDLNEDGRIGPAEWKARRGRLPIELDFRSQGRFRGNKAGRSSVGEGRPARPADTEKAKQRPEPDKSRKVEKKKRLEES